MQLRVLSHVKLLMNCRVNQQHLQENTTTIRLLSYPLLVPPMASPFFHPIPRNMAAPNDVTGIS